MTDNIEPVKVSANAGITDGVQSALRSIAFLLATGVAVVGLVRTRDLAGIVTYLQTHLNDVVAALSGLIGLGLAGYGALKAHRRGTQLATVAADSRVPDAVAQIKEK